MHHCPGKFIMGAVEIACPNEREVILLKVAVILFTMSK